MFKTTKSLALIASLFVISFSASVTADVLYFDFGETAQQTANNYNNVTQAQLPIFNALDSNGVGTGIGLTTVGFNPGSNQSGTTTPSGDAAIFDPQATRDNLFGHVTEFNQPTPLPIGTLTFTGLDATGMTAYDMVFFGSRLGPTDNRETAYAATGANSATAYLDTSENVSNVATISGMIPDAAGSIVVNVTPGPNNDNPSGFFYLGALEMTSMVVPEPSSALLAMVGLGLFFLRRRV